MSIRFAAAPLALLVAIVALVGCSRKPPAPASTTPPTVSVARPVAMRVQDYEDFAGHTEAFQKAELKSRVTGHLVKIHVTDGQDVKKGDRLFDIDDREYKAKLGQANAAWIRSQENLKTVTDTYNRVKAAYEGGVEGKEAYDTALGAKRVAQSDVEAALSSKELAETNLQFCRITAPFDGRLSKHAVDIGNLIKADETPLTTIVSRDKLYVTFDKDERTFLGEARELPPLVALAVTVGYRYGPGLLLASVTAPQQVKIALADEDSFTLTAEVVFEDNQIDVGTGTRLTRALLTNTHISRPPWELLAGQFVRVRVPLGSPRDVLLVPERALGSDQGQRYLYVVTAENVAQRRNVKVGQLHEVKVAGVSEQYRVIEEGAVLATDRIIVEGLLRVRQNAEVNPKEEAKPAAKGEKK